MEKSTEIRSGRHCVFNMHVHLVFVAKYRRKIFDRDSLKELKTIFNHVCKNFEAELVEMDGETDHVHLLVNYPSKVAVSALVNSLKGVSSRKLKQTCHAIQKHYFKNKLWSRSYFASSCGGAPIEIVRKYIENQKTPN